MRIFVEYTGVIKSNSGKKQEWVEIEENTYIEDLLFKVGYKKDFHKFIATRINGQEAFLDTPLSNETTITLFLPAGGG